MKTLTATFLSVFLASILALPSRADDGSERVNTVPVGAYAERSLQLAAGVWATAVQLSVYGSCRVLGGDHLPCLENADVAGRRAVGRPLLVERGES